MDERIDVDACPCAPCIKHHSVEDAAMVCRAAETRKNAPGAARQVQERRVDLGSAQAHSGDQEQQRHRELHLHSGGSAKNRCSL